MKKRFCDRCGAEIKNRWLFAKTRSVALESWGVSEQTFDLCDKCYTEVRQFITKRPEIQKGDTTDD